MLLRFTRLMPSRLGWKRTVIRVGVVYLPLIVISLAILFPFYWMVIASFGDPAGFRVDLLPSVRSFSLDSYRWVLFRLPFARWFLNSVLISGFATVMAVVTSVFAAYALSRMHFRGRQVFTAAVVVTQLLPSILLAIPWFVILAYLGLVNTHFGLIITYLTIALPFSIWMLYGYFQSIPTELEDAAMVDGCTRASALIRVVLPLAAPGVATVALFAFVLGWEEFLYALLIMSSDDRITVTVGAARLLSDQTLYFGYLSAYGVLTVLPVALVFGVLQRYLVRGLTMGALK